MWTGYEVEEQRVAAEHRRARALRKRIETDGPIPLTELFCEQNFGPGLDLFGEQHRFADDALRYTHERWAAAVTLFVGLGWGYVSCENAGQPDARFVLRSLGRL